MTSHPTILAVGNGTQDADVACSVRAAFDGTCRILTAASTEDALAILGQEEVHVVLADQRLPGTSGVQLLGRVRSASPDTARILIIDPVDLQAAVDAIGHGDVRRYILRPYSSAELRTVTHYEIEHRDLVRANRHLAEELIRKVEALETANNSLRVMIEAMEVKGRALEQANQDLQSLDEMKDNFQANVSHEIKTPLVAGMGYIELMMHGGLGPVSEQQRRCLEVSYRNLTRLVHLIEDLLAFNQIRFSHEGLFRTQFALHRLVRECVDEALDRSQEKDVRVDIDIPQDLPLAHADRDKVHRVFSNLISNAEKFTDKDTVRIAIRARTTPSSRIEVQVQDDGIGIPQDKIEVVFERFLQIDGSPTRRYGGMGLGLALVREILTAHGCRVSAASAETGGTTFTFDLPTGEEAVGGTAADATATAKPSNGTKRILVIDDEPYILDFVRMVLSRGPYECVLASSGEEGLAALSERTADLVLLDLAMEGMDGLEVCRRIKSDPGMRTVPVHMFSAMTDERAVRDAFEAGCDGYIKKPFKVEDFLDRVQTILHIA